MGKISSYANNSSPATSFRFLGTDPTNTSEGSTGTTETVTLATLESLISGGGGSVPGMNVIYMDAHGADNTGSLSVTSIFNTQLAAQGGAPCLFVFGEGTYKWSPAPNALTVNQCVSGLGKSVTNFTWSGSGPLFTLNMPTSGWDGSGNAGRLSGFSITGPFGSGGTAGIRYGAVQGLRLDDIGFYGLDGSCVAGYQVTPSTDWAEEGIFTRLDISECGATSKSIFSFTTTSFDYTLIDAVVVVEAGIDIVAVTGGAVMQGLELGLRGNLHGGTSNAGAVISCDRGSPSTASLVGGATMRISMEGDGSGSGGGSGTVGHYLLWMGSTSSVSQFSGQGTFSVFNAGAPDQGVYNPNFLPVSFAGILGGEMLQGEAQVVYGGQALTANAMGFSTLGTGSQTVYNQFFDVASFQLSSGSVTIVMGAASTYVRRMTFLLRQPLSGAAGTVTWPASFVFPGGTKPALSTVNGYVDRVDALWDPSSAKYYASLAGTHYA